MSTPSPHSGALPAPPRRIRLLPPALRNQIAAGEVVERPASVLKELVENSLDAGADDIAITLEDGGQTLIAVRDNGAGIPAEDLELAVTRHATSKVASFDELLRVASYGFRGEALPSIASVSALRVESACALPREDGPPKSPAEASAQKEIDIPGAFVEVLHGEITASGPAAIRQGTLIEVRDLFANVPARLKFLKTPATELKRCQEALVRLALARPGVSFSLTVGGGTASGGLPGTDKPGGREILRLTAGMDLRDRLARIWPPQVTAELVPFDGVRHQIRAHGLISLPQTAQAKGDRMLVYVNGRPVSDRLLLRALREAYKGRLTSREYPQAVLFLEIDPQEVDVNVHPAKSEVRFRDERAVFGAVLKTLEAALADHSPGSFGDFAQGERGWSDGEADPAAKNAPPVWQPLPPLYDGDRETGAREKRPEGFWGSLDRPRIMDFPTRGERSEGAFEAVSDPDGEPAPVSAGGFPAPSADPVSLAGPFPGEGVPSFPSAGTFSPSFRPASWQAREQAEGYLPAGVDRAGESGSTKVPGGSGDTAVPFPAGRDTLPDGAPLRREAQERRHGGYPVTVGPLTCLGQVADTYLILLQGDTLLLLDQHAAHERVLLHSIEQQAESAQSQLLAIPAELPLHPAEKIRMQELFDRLLRLGYSLSMEGEDLLVVRGLPPLLDRGQGLALLRDILADKTDGIDNLLHLMACRSAVKAGQPLTADEAAGLLSQWMATPDCRFCPHGRPTVLALAPADLEKMFKRNVG